MKHPISRRQPGFHLFLPPVPAAGSPAYSNPLVRVMGCQQLDLSAQNERRFPDEPLQQDHTGTVNPRMVARRIAEAFEYQGFIRGTGSGPTPDYEGCVCILGIGDTARDYAIPDIPTLMTHPWDAVAAALGQDQAFGANGANCWYNARGVAAVQAWMEEFLEVLVDELDNPDGGMPLCYPAHFAFDLEYALPFAQFAINKTGNFTDEGWGWWEWALNDPRASIEVLIPGTPDQTMESIALETPDIDEDQRWTDPFNRPFTNWFDGVTLTIVSAAMKRALYDPVKAVFPLAKCSNYNTYIADDPKLPIWNPFPNDWAQMNVAELQADSQAPDYYGPFMREADGDPNPRRLANETDQHFWRRFLLHQIIAFWRSANRLRNTPWIPAPGLIVRPHPGVAGYSVTNGDFLWLLTRLWQRGIDEFIVFAAGLNTTSDMANLSKQIKFFAASVCSPRRRQRWFLRHRR